MGFGVVVMGAPVEEWALLVTEIKERWIALNGLGQRLQMIHLNKQNNLFELLVFRSPFCSPAKNADDVSK